MDSEIKRIRILNNRFSFYTYLYLYFVLETILLYVYSGCFATFSINGSRTLVLILIVIFLSSINLVFTWRYERNWISLISGTLIPFLLYETITMWNYSLAIRLIVIDGAAIAFFWGIYWSKKKTRWIKKDQIKNKVFAIKAFRFARILICIVLLVSVILGKYLVATHYTVTLSAISFLFSNSDDYTPDYENSLAANISTVAKLDPEGGWSSLSTDDKMNVLETIVRIECRYLGMHDSAPSLKLAFLDEGLLGEYDSESDVITISYNYLVDSRFSGYPVVQVLCHELFHRYQHYQVDLIKTLRNSEVSEKYTDLLLLEMR